MKKTFLTGLLVIGVAACSSSRSRGGGGTGGTGGGAGGNAGDDGGGEGGTGGMSDGSTSDKGVKFDPDAKSCGEQTTPIMVDPQVPDLLIVFDRSGSMSMSFGMGTRFSVETEILTKLLNKFQGQVRFGFSEFPYNGSCTGAFECCAEGKVKIAPNAGNASKIIAALKAAQSGIASQTPTPHALRVARTFYEGLNDGVTKRYVLLSTDGEPNCTVDGKGSNPNASCPEAVTEIQGMLAKGIKTIVLGVSSQGAGPCLSSMGNAGGAPAPPPNDGYYSGNDPASLEQALSDIIAGIAKPSCTFPLKDVPPDKSRVAVFFDGMQVPWDPTHTDGWDYDPDPANAITVYGSYCGKVQGFEIKSVDVRFGCTPCGGTVSCG